MGFAPTWLRQVTPPLLRKTTLTTAYCLFKECKLHSRGKPLPNG